MFHRSDSIQALLAAAPREDLCHRYLIYSLIAKPQTDQQRNVTRYETKLGTNMRVPRIHKAKMTEFHRRDFVTARIKRPKCSRLTTAGRRRRRPRIGIDFVADKCGPDYQVAPTVLDGPHS